MSRAEVQRVANEVFESMWFYCSSDDPYRRIREELADCGVRLSRAELDEVVCNAVEHVANLTHSG